MRPREIARLEPAAFESVLCCLGPQLVVMLQRIEELRPGLTWYVADAETGVFAGVPSSIAQPAFRAGGLWTEDEEAADLGDAVVELRAFDTSFWSIATAAPELATSIRTQIERKRDRSP